MAHNVFNLDRLGLALKPAWHGLGKVFDRLMTTLEVLQETSVGAYQVIQGAGFVAYDPITNKVWHGGDESSPALPPPNYRLIATSAMFNFRDDLSPRDANAILSPVGVGRGYEVVQNNELCEIADAVIGGTGARYESAGTLKNGKLVWLLARMPENIDVAGDRVAKYILIYQSHDSSAPIVVAATSVRVVCYNTLSFALSDNKENENRVMIKHTTNAKERIAEAIVAVQKVHERFERDGAVFNSMARKAVDARFVDSFLKSLYPDPKGGNAKQSEKKRSAITDLIFGDQAGGRVGAMLRDGQPTQWAVINGVAQYWQHESRIVQREGMDVGENRFKQNMMGGTQELQRSRAFDLLQRSDDVLSAAVAAN